MIEPTSRARERMGAAVGATQSGAIPPPPPSVPTLGTTSELVRNDRLALFLYKFWPDAALCALILQEYTAGLAAGPGSFFNSWQQPHRCSVFTTLPHDYFVIRVIRVSTALILNLVYITLTWHLPSNFRQRKHIQ